ncbi:MAG: PH domain-containing protein, partial [Flavobacteriales bacterium]
MNNEPLIIKKADFNPKIKNYVLLLGCFVLIVSFIGIPLLIVWLLGLGNYIGKRYHKSLSCKLTENHLEFKKGVFFKVEKTIPLENIQDLTFLENPILNWLELKILKIETAGNSKPGSSDMKLIGIMDSANFKKSV